MPFLHIFFGLLLLVISTSAGYNPQSKTNLAVYWGQNSANTHVASVAQGRFGDYCNDANVDIFLIAFLTSITDGQGNFAPILNLANQGQRCDVSKSPYTCPEFEADIRTCQADKQKMILLSLGGYTSAEQGFKDDEKARAAARKLWEMFGPPTSDPPNPNRPFGSSVVDGFDFDFEREIPGMGEFGRELRRLMGGDNKGGRILTAAPMCVLPTQNSMYDQIPLHMVFVQFYNETQCQRSFRDWNDWAWRKNTMFSVGLPASINAAGSGYVEPNHLGNVFREAKSLGRMGGAILWDASQAWSNHNYHTAVKKALIGGKMAEFRG